MNNLNVNTFKLRGFTSSINGTHIHLYICFVAKSARAGKMISFMNKPTPIWWAVIILHMFIILENCCLRSFQPGLIVTILNRGGNETPKYSATDTRIRHNIIHTQIYLSFLFIFFFFTNKNISYLCITTH